VPAKSLLAVLGVSAVALSLGAVAACSGTTSDTTSTITGVLIRAETLTAGRGCGRSPSQVFKYAAVVFAESSSDPAKPEYALPLTASVFDCYADGAFVNVPPSPVNGSSAYKIELYVYDEADFTPKAAIIGGALGATPNTQQLRENAPPTWSTTCYATQVQDVQSLAVCDPIQFGLAGVGLTSSASVRLDTASFALEEGGSVTCAPSDDGGAPDGGSGDAGDAGADAAVTPTIVGGYGNVRVTPSAGTAQGTPTTVRCPQPYVLDPALPLQTYSLDVEVFSPDGTAVVGRTTCSATARPGLTAVPTCAPLH
jgi:hypothetical protein